MPGLATISLYRKLLLFFKEVKSLFPHKHRAFCPGLKLNVARGLEQKYFSICDTVGTYYSGSFFLRGILFRRKRWNISKFLTVTRFHRRLLSEDYQLLARLKEN